MLRRRHVFVLVTALFLFSNDPGWITYLIATLVITVGAFRFGTAGTWSDMPSPLTIRLSYTGQIFGKVIHSPSIPA